jgi:periplasmic divalent cation tolerance protein
MSAACTVYVTAASHGEAVSIARTVVAERLAACANILPAVTSVYHWQGQVQEDAEVALLLKTETRLFDRLATRIRELHSYDTPCIVAWPIVAGDAAYLAWLGAEIMP